MSLSMQSALEDNIFDQLREYGLQPTRKGVKKLVQQKLMFFKCLTCETYFENIEELAAHLKKNKQCQCRSCDKCDSLQKFRKDQSLEGKAFEEYSSFQQHVFIDILRTLAFLIELRKCRGTRKSN